MDSIDNSVFEALNYAVRNKRKEMSKEAAKRGKKIVSMRNKGMKFKEIGDKFGFGEQRAADIYNKYK